MQLTTTISKPKTRTKSIKGNESEISGQCDHNSAP